MSRKFEIVVIVLLLISIFTVSNKVAAETDNEIIFNDKNLHEALSKYYNWNKVFTKEMAYEFTKKDNLLVIRDAKITDLEGLQYFGNIVTLYAGGNNFTNLKPISMLNKLRALDISDNAIKGRDFQAVLNNMGKLKNLDAFIINNNELTNISFLSKIGTMKNYTYMRMVNNKIYDITLLKEATNLETLDLSNNRITDVTPLKDLKNFEYWLGLQDNCILDYKPIKPILDKIYEEGGWDGVISRYDYYTNPVGIGVNGKTIKFPYLTAYYKYQAYVEAVPLLKALGGSVKYDKKTGTLTCKYGDNVLVMTDFSKNYTLNGEQMSMKYPMRRMQYDIAYVPVKDICKALELNYSVIKKRKIYEKEDEYFYAPKYIEISLSQKELR